MSRPNSSDTAPVHNRIELLRADRGMSRRALADALGVHYQTVGYLERGDYKPSLVLALKIAELFELPVEQVFSLTPFPSLASQLGAVKGSTVNE